MIFVRSPSALLGGTPIFIYYPQKGFYTLKHFHLYIYRLVCIQIPNLMGKKKKNKKEKEKDI